MFDVFLVVEQGWEVGINIGLINYLDNYINVLLIFQRITYILEIYQLFRSIQKRITISKLQYVRFFPSVNNITKFFLKLHSNNVDGLISCL